MSPPIQARPGVEAGAPSERLGGGKLDAIVVQAADNHGPAGAAGESAEGPER